MLTLTWNLDEKKGTLDKNQDTLNLNLPGGIQNGHQGGQHAEDGVDVGAEHGDVGQEIVELVGFVERVGQLLNLKKLIFF